MSWPTCKYDASKYENVKCLHEQYRLQIVTLRYDLN